MQPVSEIDVEDMVMRAIRAQDDGTSPVEYLQGVCVDMAGTEQEEYADDLYDACIAWVEAAGGW